MGDFKGTVDVIKSQMRLHFIKHECYKYARILFAETWDSVDKVVCKLFYNKEIKFHLKAEFNINNLNTTVLGKFINTMKTTFDFNFDLNQAFKQNGYTKT